MKYKVNDAKENTVDVSFEEGRIILNGKEVNIDLVNLSNDRFHIIQNNQSYNLEVVEADLANKQFTVKVNDQVYQLSLENQLDQQLREMGMSTADSEKIDKVIAPMPGLVLQILVTPGQEVKKGDSLIILEAMKMENIIKCAGSGIVKSIFVRQKDAVEKNQILIEME